MATHGFTVTVGSDGGLASGDLPSAQAATYNLALFTCEASYPLDPKYNAPLNESQRRFLYDYLSNELVDCLEEEGFDIGSPPSWQQFTESLDGESMWSPFNELSGISPRRFHEVSEACPQIPTGLYG
ncbi:hypothetical protein [Agromyces larvae]|uniref:Uncharacterized protein n=1 Tax=Agromyces larvae TaxID=2929802 RepID=A0ABY4BUD1_9MICO|nr:hypothetical protein [Agromyces larvae]UOE42822.1 hypothetical protein MTO99_11535 [Agromyces larvae]